MFCGDQRLHKVLQVIYQQRSLTIKMILHDNWVVQSLALLHPGHQHVRPDDPGLSHWRHGGVARDGGVKVGWQEEKVKRILWDKMYFQITARKWPKPKELLLTWRLGVVNLGWREGVCWNGVRKCLAVLQFHWYLLHYSLSGRHVGMNVQETSGRHFGEDWSVKQYWCKI